MRVPHTEHRKRSHGAMGMLRVPHTEHRERSHGAMGMLKALCSHFPNEWNWANEEAKRCFAGGIRREANDNHQTSWRPSSRKEIPLLSRIQNSKKNILVNYRRRCHPPPPPSLHHHQGQQQQQQRQQQQQWIMPNWLSSDLHVLGSMVIS